MNNDAHPVLLNRREHEQLHRKANRPALYHLLVYICLLTLLVYPVVLSLTGWFFALLPLGIMLAFFFNLSHECTHKTVFRTPWLNEAVGHLTGIILFQPFSWFRYFHLAHHRFVNDPARDPELLGHPKPDTWPALLVYFSCGLYWRDKAQLLWVLAFGKIESDYLPARKHSHLRVEARLYLLIYSLMAGIMLLWLSVVVWIWLVPLLLGFPFLRLYHLGEHGLCRPVASRLINTRTILTNRLVRFITWNMPFHIEHHLLPGVPFYRLPDVHKIVKDKLGTVAYGYASFIREYARSLTS